MKTFWRDEFPKYSFRNQADGIAPIQNRVGLPGRPKAASHRGPGAWRTAAARGHGAGKSAVGQPLTRQDGRRQLGAVGRAPGPSLGSAAFGRASRDEASRRPFFLYVDEFQSFTTLALANMLSELRKFGVGLVMAHQYLQQLDPAIAHAVLGNDGTLIAFRLGAYDAGMIARQFEPVFQPVDLQRLPNRHIALKLMIDGMPSRPFGATTLVHNEIARINA